MLLNSNRYNTLPKFAEKIAAEEILTGFSPTMFVFSLAKYYTFEELA